MKRKGMVVVDDTGTEVGGVVGEVRVGPLRGDAAPTTAGMGGMVGMVGITIPGEGGIPGRGGVVPPWGDMEFGAVEFAVVPSALPGAGGPATGVGVLAAVTV